MIFAVQSRTPLALLCRSCVVPTWFVLVALLGPADAPLAAPPPATGPLVADLIRDIASDDWRTRESAVERLVALGDDALPPLREIARNSPDAEVRSRAESAISRINDNRQIGQTLVTLHLDKAPAADAFEELSRQGRGKILHEPAGLFNKHQGKPVTLHLEQAPFWTAMRALCRQTGLSPLTVQRQNRPQGLGVTRGDGDWDRKPIMLSGPLLVRADRLTRISSIPLRDPANATSDFSISLTVFAEPKLKVLDYSGILKLTEAVDDKGQSLLPPDAAPADDVELMGNPAGGVVAQWDLNASLAYPKRAGDRIVRLKGMTTFEVQIASARLELLLGGTTNIKKNLDGVRILIKTLDASRCDLSIFRDGRSDAEWHRLRGRLLNADPVLVDEKGRTVARPTRSPDADMAGDDSQRMDLQLRFGRDGQGDDSRDSKTRRGEAVKLVWEFPTDTRIISVPLEFFDLPIPK